MPPRLKLMAAAPAAPFQMATRAKNKTSHPGYVDLLHPPNPDIPKIPEKTAEEKAQEEARLLHAAKNAAGIQDTLAREDAVREASRQAERAVNEAKGKQFVTSICVLLILYTAVSVGRKHKPQTTPDLTGEDDEQRKYFENSK